MEIDCNCFLFKQIKFSQNHALGRIVNDTKEDVKNEVQVHCVPFFGIYKAIGREEIDLFVLDIEGHEVEVLQTIPWDKINILVKLYTLMLTLRKIVKIKCQNSYRCS